MKWPAENVESESKFDEKAVNDASADETFVSVAGFPGWPDYFVTESVYFAHSECFVRFEYSEHFEYFEYSAHFVHFGRFAHFEYWFVEVEIGWVGAGEVALVDGLGVVDEFGDSFDASNVVAVDSVVAVDAVVEMDVLVWLNSEENSLQDTLF